MQCVYLQNYVLITCTSYGKIMLAMEISQFISEEQYGLVLLMEINEQEQVPPSGVAHNTKVCDRNHVLLLCGLMPYLVWYI